MRVCDTCGKPIGLSTDQGFIKLVSSGVEAGEWADQFRTWHFHDSEGEMKVYHDLVNKEWSVISEGALDYEGNRTGLLARYPQLKTFSKELR